VNSFDIDLLQRQIREWHDYNFPSDNLENSALGLSEETGEVCRAVLKQGQNIRGTKDFWDAEIRKEIGDVFIKLVEVASKLDSSPNSFATIILDRWEEIQQRNWIKFPQDGKTK
jgi:NTP pyrophosphatase (non-canonical NTP hydrolase)